MTAEKEKGDRLIRDKSQPPDEKETSPPGTVGHGNEDVNPAITDSETSEAHEAGLSETEDEPDHDDRDHDHDHEQEHERGPAEEPVQPQSSRASSIFSRSQSVIPRSQRRGVFGKLAVIPEIERPYEYRNRTKWAITAIIALAAGAAPMGSGIFYPALSQMAVDLNTSKTVTNLAVALYMLSMSIFPLWWSSFSETMGRRTIYVISFTLFVIFTVLSAISVNITMLIIMRVISGGAAASVQAVGAGTIADIWEPAERGKAMGIFYLGPLIGPLFAPIVGGALSQGFGWRSTMWFLVIYGGLVLIMIIFCLPETLPRRKPILPPAQTTNGTVAADTPNALARTSTVQSVKEKTKKTGVAFKRFIVDPLEILLYLRFPAVIISVYSASIAFGSLFVLNISIQSSYSQAPYNFSEIIVGLLYLPLSIGYLLASVLGGRWIDQIMAREARKAGRYDERGKLIFLPEDRMRENMWLAASLYPAALIWFGWTIDKGVHWVVPSIANFFFGLGSMLVFGTVTTVLTEFMPKRSSSGVAVNNFVRNIFSCVGAIVAQPLIDAMGDGWLCTMLALFALVTGNMAIWALRRWGPKWRIQMDKKLNEPGA